MNHQKERQKKSTEAFNKKLVPMEGKCIFKLKQKARLCYQQVNLGDSKLYCRFHLDQETIEVDESHHLDQIQADGKVLLGKDTKKYEMVTCPYEPKNQVLKSKLEDHLKTCPKKRELEEIASKPFYQKGINFMNPELFSCFDNQIKDNMEN